MTSLVLTTVKMQYLTIKGVNKKYKDIFQQ